MNNGLAEKTDALIKSGYTADQAHAIADEGNIIVSAGAGSGKTSVMIERIVQKLKDGATLGEMVISTFTRASAADMRVKLTQKLAALKDGPYGAMARAALDDISVSNIGTLHSYCQRLIRTYFYAAGLDPSFAVCDDKERDALLLSSASDAVRSALDVGDAYFEELYEMFISRRDDANIDKAVFAVAEFALSMPDPIDYLDGIKPDKYYSDILDAETAAVKDALSVDADALKVRLKNAGMGKHVEAVEKLGKLINGETDKVVDPRESKNYRIDPILHEEYKQVKKRSVALYQKLKKYDESKQYDSEKYSRALCSVAKAAIADYTNRKARLRKIDYSDLEHGAYRVLCDRACADEISSKVKYVFVDEFQDINPLQNAIIALLKSSVEKRGGELFVVGDVKQSIYGFRQCSPEHFERAIADKSFRHIAMSANFRSSQPVVDFVDKVFSGVMTRDFGGADYSDPAHRMVRANMSPLLDADNPECGAEFVIIPKDVKPKEQPSADDVSSISDNASSISDSDGVSSISAPVETDIADESAAESADESADGDGSEDLGYSVINDKGDGESRAEAVFVADRIIRWIGRSRSDGDIPDTVAVLVRTVKREFTSALARELNRRGVGHVLQREDNAEEFPDAAALVDIMRCLDNRYDDVALYTALRSPMGGFSDEEIAALSSVGRSAAKKRGVIPLFGRDGKYSLWQKLEAYYGELGERRDKFLSLREQMIKYARKHDCADVLGYITSRIDYFQYVYEKGGDARAVQALIDYAAKDNADMHTFLTYYDETTFKLSTCSGSALVTVTTIHRSKGLQYGYVIVADLSKKFNDDELKDSLIVSERGVFVKVPDKSKELIVESAPMIVEKSLYPTRAHGEELRMLYVALTRAEKRLTVCATADEVKETDPRDAKTMLDFMQNVQPTVWDGIILPIGDDEIAPPSPEQKSEVYSALVDGFALLDGYNASRQTGVPIKASVTALAHADEDGLSRAVVFDRDRQSGGADGETARRRGSAYHRALELIDFSAPDPDSLKGRCEDIELVDEKLLLKAAKVMAELTRGASFVAKERYFIASLPTAALYGSGKDSVLVQGVIDLMFADGKGGVTIVDYKTGDPDAVRGNEGYKRQLRLYAAAVERAVPAFKAKRLLLYCIESGETIEVSTCEDA